MKILLWNENNNTGGRFFLSNLRCSIYRFGCKIRQTFPYLVLFIISSVAFGADRNREQSRINCAEVISQSRRSVSNHFTQNLVSESGVEIRLSKVLDFYQASGEFPRIEFFHARPIRHSEIVIILNKFIQHSQKIRRYSLTLSGLERSEVEAFADFILDQVELFSRNHDAFSQTSEILTKLKGMSSRIKGRGFETLVWVLLSRSGFSEISHGIEIRLADGTFVEIDVMAQQGNQWYVFELKNIHPDARNDQMWLMQVEKKIEQQVAKLKALKLARSIQVEGGEPKVVVLLHFFLGEAFADKVLDLGADQVIHLHREFSPMGDMF